MEFSQGFQLPINQPSNITLIKSEVQLYIYSTYSTSVLVPIGKRKGGRKSPLSSPLIGLVQKDFKRVVQSRNDLQIYFFARSDDSVVMVEGAGLS